MNMKRIIFDHLSGLYEYPAAAYPHKVAACRQALDGHVADSGDLLKPFEKHCDSLNKGELEEMFTRTFDFDPKNFETGSASVTISVSSINTGIDDRDNHLRTSDFFDVDEISDPVVTNNMAGIPLSLNKG